PSAGEEIAAGPLATVRFLRLTARSLSDISRFGRPRVPAPVTSSSDGRLLVPVMPSGILFDRLLFGDYSARVRMQPDVTEQNLGDHLAAQFRLPRQPAIALVLGAGNVASIPATDALGKLFHEGRVVLLKMNPVNDYLGPLFERAFRRLVDLDALRIVYGGADV